MTISLFIRLRLIWDLDQAREQTKPLSVKKNTTIPADLAQQAEAQGINFSQTLTDALKQKLAVG